MNILYIKILNREIPISCKKEDELKVKNLAKDLATRLQELKQKSPNIGDLTLMILNSLMLMDELNLDNQSKNTLEKVAESLEKVADDIEELADKVGN